MDSDDDQERLLLQALIQGNVTEVERFFTEADSRDFPINCPLELNRKYNVHLEEPTALTVAAEHGHRDCVRKLLEMGGELYSVGKIDDMDEDEDPLDPLVKASIFISDDYFYALIIACSKGQSETLQELTDFRLFKVPNIYDKYKEYSNAAKAGDFQSIMALLDSVENGCMFLKGWKGHNIMNISLLNGCSNVCLQKMLDCGISVDGWDYNGMTPLMCAIIARNLECVQFLLGKGADPYEIHILRRMSFQDDGTVLYINDMGEEMHLQSDSEKDWGGFYQDHVGPTALMYASVTGDVPIIKLMLEAAPKDIPSLGRFERWCGIGPLDFAVNYASIDVVSLILQYEAANEEVHHDVLCAAVKRGDTELLDFLLGSNIMWDNKDLTFHFAMLSCINSNNAKHLARIFDHFGTGVFDIVGGQAFLYAIESDALDCLNMFLKHQEFSVDGKYSSFPTDAKTTPFMFSCFKGLLERAKMFFEMGANVNAVDNSGKTAAMYAARDDQVKSLEYLDGLNAEFDTASEEGETVFSAALLGDGSSLEFLLKTGKVLNKNGLKPIHKESIKVFEIDAEEDGYGGDKRTIPIKNIQILVQYKIFHWEWCAKVNKKSLRSLIFVAVTSGIAPEKFLHNEVEVSPLIYAIKTKDVALFRYILANRFFSPEDCQFVTKNNDIITMDESPELAFLIEKLNLQPLSLLRMSSATISGSLSSSDGSPNDRNSQVDSLPLPTAVKNSLKFNFEFSKLCPRLWKRLGPQKDANNDEGFSYVVRNGEVVRNLVLEKCTKGDCQCSGQGLVWEDVDGEELDEDDVDSDEDEEWEDVDDNDDDGEFENDDGEDD